MSIPQAKALPLAHGRRGRNHLARPAGAKKPAHLRELRRAPRHVSRAALRRRREGGRLRSERRQFFLRRRRARHHRPARRDGHEEPARLHAHDRRSREGDAPLPKAGDRGGRRHLRRRRRDHRHGRRHPLRHAGGEDRLSLHPRRARRLRHGRLRDPPAHHRAGQGGGASLHRPHDERGGGRALGLLQSPRPGREPRSAKPSPSRNSSRAARPSRTA